MFHSLRLSAGLIKPLTSLTKTSTFAGGRSLNIYRTFYNNVPRSNGLRFTSNTVQVNNTYLQNKWPSICHDISFQKKLLEPKSVLRTTVCRYCAEASKNPKTKKIVGYWLLGSSGMVFIAVVLGAVSAYYGLMYCVFIVIEEVIKFTIQ